MVDEYIEEDLILYLDMHNDYWDLDSDTSYHASSHKGYFIKHGHGNFGHVKLGNDHHYKIVGIDKVKIILHNGN